MIIRVKQSWKDHADGSRYAKHYGILDRRAFIQAGFLTGTMSLLLPEMLVGKLAKEAMADAVCPAPVRSKGAFVHMWGENGVVVGSRFISDAQAGIVAGNTTAASNYGVVGSDLVRLGPNCNVSVSSAFGAALGANKPGTTTNPPYPGYTSAEWAALLNQVSMGYMTGMFNQDDGGADGDPMWGSFSGFKKSQMNKDIRIGSQHLITPWGQGTPSSSIGGNTTALTSASLAKVFGITPSGLTNPSTVTSTAAATNALANIFGSVFGLSARKGGSNVITAASCGFQGDAVMADPTYGSGLFTPTGIADLSGKITLTDLTAENQAALAAIYQSAMGVGGGVFFGLPNRDQHANTQATNLVQDQEEGALIASWIAACDRAQSKGALVWVTNGQAISAGTTGGQTITTTVGGVATNLTVNATNASSDAGGSLNACFVLLFTPSSMGAPPVTKTFGTFNTGNGNFATTGAPSPNEALASAYLTAVAHLGFDLAAATRIIQATGIATTVKLLI
jgi:hypothetical protein